MFGPITPRREGMTLIHRAAGMLEAEVVRGRLESSGIRVMLDYESLGRVMGLTVDGLGEVRIFVPAEQAEDAQALLTASASEDESDAEEEEPE